MRYARVLFILVFTLALSIPSAPHAAALTYRASLSQATGSLFWRFLPGSVTFINLAAVRPWHHIAVPADTDVILVYARRYDYGLRFVDRRGKPTFFLGYRWWLVPSPLFAYRFFALHGFEDILWRRLTLFRPITYASLGLLSAPRNVVIIHRTPLCGLLPWWHWRHFWCTGSSRPVHTFSFKLFAPLTPGRTTIDRLSVVYRINVMREDTGQSIRNGAVIPTGTPLLISFPELRNQDIVWYSPVFRYLTTYLRIRFHHGFWIAYLWRWSDWLPQRLSAGKHTGVWVAPGQVPDTACREEDAVVSRPWVRFHRLLLNNIVHFVTLAVERPVRHIDGLDQLNCSSTATGWRCVPTQAGEVTLTFHFDKTTARAYHSYRRGRWRWWYGWETGACRGAGAPLYQRTRRWSRSLCDRFLIPPAFPYRCHRDDEEEHYEYALPFENENDLPDEIAEYTPFTYTIPKQSLSLTLRIQPSNRPPAAPTITSNGYGGVGSDNLFHLSSTDPDHDRVAYEVAWGDGTAPERVPSDGWVAEATDTPATHRYQKAGAYTLSVVAIDQYNHRSEPATATFTVYGTPTLTFTADAYLIPRGGSTMLRWQSAGATSCRASGAWSGDKSLEGGERSPTLQATSTLFFLSCENPVASTTESVRLFTYRCGDNVCTTNVEDCHSCPADCGACGITPKSLWDIFIDLTSDPARIRYGVDPDEVKTQ